MKKIFSLILLIALVPLNSCQDVLECIINRRPELSSNALAPAQVGLLYSEIITADIKNEPSDDSYNYYFSIDGALPRGIDYYIDYRTIIIEGTPSVSGTYNFTVRLSVEQAFNYAEDCENRLNDCDGLCEESTSKAYKIEVN